MGEFFGRIVLGGIFGGEFFGRNFLGEIFGRNFLGGFFWEEFFGRNSLFTLELTCCQDFGFCQDFEVMEKKEGRRILILRSVFASSLQLKISTA